MAAIFRLVAPDGSTAGEAESLDGISEVARAAPPGRYRLEQTCPDPGAEDPGPWVWGEIIKRPDGTIELDLPPWID
jgi:hypothetical protein